MIDKVWTNKKKSLFKVTVVFLYLIAAFWVVFGALWLFRESDYRWFYAIGAFSNATVLSLLTYFMSRGWRWAYWLLVLLLVANVILTVTDQIGWFDLVYLVPAIVALAMVISIRSRVVISAAAGNYATKYIGQTARLMIDRPLGSHHPKYQDLIYECNYGFIPGTQAPDGEAIDAYLLGVKEPLKEYTGRCLAVIHRTNEEDDKLVIVPDDAAYTDEQIKRLTEFQEKYHQSEIIRKK